MKKYELTNETTKVNGRTLYRIRALKTISTNLMLVQEGELGGFVESEFNLAQEGNCWIGDNAVVFKNARVYDNAIIRGHSYIYGNARVFHNATIQDSSCSNSTWIYGTAAVYDSICRDSSLIYDRAVIERSTIRDFSRINGYPSVIDSLIRDCAQITGQGIVRHSVVRGNSVISDYGSIVQGTAEHNAKISQEQKVITSTCATDLTKDLSESIRTQTGFIPFNGQVIAYKQVCKDLTSFHDNCFQYKVGEWAVAQNAEESTRSCASGLHFANAGYWNDHHEGILDSTFLIARINLEDIITVQQGKIRCRKAFILGTYDVKKINI